MAQEHSSKQRQIPGRKKKSIARLASPGSRYEFAESVLERYFDELTGVDDRDDDEMPDDEHTDYFETDTYGDLITPTGLEEKLGEEFYTYSLPQMVQCIVYDSNTVQVLTQFGSSKYADIIRNHLKEWTENNWAEILSMQPVGIMDPLALDEQTETEIYREIQKNLQDLTVLLPNLHIIKLKDIYRFRRGARIDSQEDEIIGMLVKIYQLQEPAGEFNGTGELFKEYILERIPGVKGHAGQKWALYYRVIQTFFEAYFNYGRQEDDYDHFRKLLTGKYDTEKVNNFLERYGERWWRRLKIK